MYGGQYQADPTLTLVQRIYYLLDLLYPEIDATQDEAIRSFRNDIIQLLNQDNIRSLSGN